MMTDQQRDELIFDYLEGNLSADEKEAFILLKNESEILNREVRLWENAFIDEALPSIDSLEQKLLIKAHPDTGTSGNIFIVRTVMLIGIMFLTGAVLDSEEYTTSESLALLGKEIPMHAADEGVSDCLKTISEERKTNYSVTKKVEPEQQKSVLKKSSQTPPPLGDPKKIRASLVNINGFLVDDTPERRIVIYQHPQGKKQVVREVKKWTREERKAIRKKLWRDLENRNANEFMKGRVPYVVPLNSNNF